MNSRDSKTEWILILTSLILALVAGVFFPIITDEAYYVDWALRSGWPRLGFFDHPPMVSWLAGFANWSHSIVSARIVVWIVHLVAIFFVWKTAKRVIPAKATAATLLVVSTIGAIANGFLLTPDVGVIAMWIIAIHEAVLALQGHPRRWLTAGVFTGLGLWSKYTMVLIGPVFLWGMLRDNRRHLATPWPYLGGLLCALVFAPHLWWQSQSDWITFRFQFGHGFSLSQTIGTASSLPAARDPDAKDDDTRKVYEELFAAMNSVSGFAESIVTPKPDKTKWEKAIQYSGDFVGGVAGLWGFYALALLGSIVLLRPTPRLSHGGPIGIRPGMGVIEAAAFFPLIFFGLLSPFSKIEANWPAMHLAPMAIWICSRHRIPIRVSATAVIVHASIIFGLMFVMAYPNSIPGARNNRILLESKGFQTLGNWVSKEFSGKALGVDSYQLKSAIRYYAPEVAVSQWPGITRGSEYTRGDLDDQKTEQRLLSQEQVTIISLKPTPKVIEGFQLESLEGVRVCPDGTIGFFSSLHPQLPCEKGLREWWVTKFRNQNPR